MVPVVEWVLSNVDCCITNLKVHRFHPALSKKVLLGVAVSVLKKKSQLQNISMPLTWVQRCWRQAEAASQPWPHSWQATFPLDALCNLIVLCFLLQENFFLILNLPTTKHEGFSQTDVLRHASLFPNTNSWRLWNFQHYAWSVQIVMMMLVTRYIKNLFEESFMDRV